MSTEKKTTLQNRKATDLNHINSLKSTNMNISALLARLHINAQRLGTIIDAIEEEQQKMPEDEIENAAQPRL